MLIFCSRPEWLTSILILHYICLVLTPLAYCAEGRVCTLVVSFVYGTVSPGYQSWLQIVYFQSEITRVTVTLLLLYMFVFVLALYKQWSDCLFPSMGAFTPLRLGLPLQLLPIMIFKTITSHSPFSVSPWTLTLRMEPKIYKCTIKKRHTLCAFVDLCI